MNTWFTITRDETTHLAHEISQVELDLTQLIRIFLELLIEIVLGFLNITDLLWHGLSTALHCNKKQDNYLLC